ncbi:hypothetical protein L218DRAFT_991203 [Marasmius fiardii PR-910]|nr:hypothetical protein L218DRAFT_991203 [Marasmius fiardii PR-910]
MPTDKVMKAGLRTRVTIQAEVRSAETIRRNDGPVKKCELSGDSLIGALDNPKLGFEALEFEGLSVVVLIEVGEETVSTSKFSLPNRVLTHGPSASSDLFSSTFSSSMTRQCSEGSPRSISEGMTAEWWKSKGDARGQGHGLQTGTERRESGWFLDVLRLCGLGPSESDSDGKGMTFTEKAVREDPVMILWQGRSGAYDFQKDRSNDENGGEQGLS